MAVPQSVFFWFDVVFHSVCVTGKVSFNKGLFAIYAAKVLCRQPPMQHLFRVAVNNCNNTQP